MELEGRLCGLKPLSKIAQTALIELNNVSAEVCEGRVEPLFFPKLNYTYKML